MNNVSATEFQSSFSGELKKLAMITTQEAKILYLPFNKGEMSINGSTDFRKVLCKTENKIKILSRSG